MLAPLATTFIDVPVLLVDGPLCGRRPDVPFRWEGKSLVPVEPGVEIPHDGGACGYRLTSVFEGAHLRWVGRFDH